MNNKKTTSNITVKIKKNSLPNFMQSNRSNKPKESFLALEEYKKYCVKINSNTNSNFSNQIRGESLKLYLDNYTLSDIISISKVLNKFFYFKNIEIAQHVPKKDESTSITKNNNNNNKNNSNSVITEGEKEKLQREKNVSKNSKYQISSIIFQSISTQLSQSQNLLSLTFYKINFNEQNSSILSQGFSLNNSLLTLNITNSQIPLNSFEIILSGLLHHEKIENINISNNNLSDKCGNMISRLISHQTQRRDQIIWLASLRNEKPLINSNSGLLNLNLSNNKLKDLSCDFIINALNSDLYLRKIDLSSNDLNKDCCKKFVKMLRKNNSLLNVDLRNNPGYDEEINVRMIMKMSKNIKILNESFNEGEIDENVFNKFKNFVDPDFFNVDVPKNIRDNYNSKFETISLENENNKKVFDDYNNNNNNLKSKNKSKSKSSRNKINKKEDYFPKKKYNLTNENKELINENIKLKKEILDLKANSLKNKIEKNNNNNKNHNKNYSLNVNDNKNYNKIINLMNELNGLINKVNNDFYDNKINNN